MRRRDRSRRSTTVLAQPEIRWPDQGFVTSKSDMSEVPGFSCEEFEYILFQVLDVR